MKALINESIAELFESKTGMPVIPLKPYNKLDLPVSAHADMLFCVLGDKIFCYEDYVLENNLLDELTGSGKSVVFVEKECNPKYPGDVGLNVLIMGKSIFCNIKHTAKEILEYAKECNYEIYDVKQGYSSCSTLVLDANYAVTSDASIYKAIVQAGKKALVINNNNIKLDGYECGFIGGGSGILGKDVFVFGDITTLQNGENIYEFIHNLGFNILHVLSGEVYDFGGIKFI